MEFDISRFIGEFISETLDNINALSNRCIEIKRDPENEEVLSNILRNLHTIKGSSRMLGFKNMESLAHNLENLFKGVREGRYKIEDDIIRLAFSGLDFLEMAIDKIKTEKKDDINIDNIIRALKKAYANEPFEIPLSKEPKIKVKAKEGKAKSQTTTHKYPQMVKVKTSLINNIMSRINSVVLKGLQINRLLSNLDDIYSLLLPMSSTKEVAKAMDIIKMLKEEGANTLQQIEQEINLIRSDVGSMQMVPLSTIFATIPRMVEELAISLGKKVNINIKDENIRADKRVIEGLRDPIIHIVRNAVDHGIEIPEERLKKGKPQEGNIEISCMQEGRYITIKIRDDGRGIDYEKIRKRASQMMPDRKEEIESMSNERLNQFLFYSGFSSKDKASKVSGRGVGLDIVKAGIEQLKGRININTQKDVGCEFVLTLPVSLAFMDGMFVRVGKREFLIPAAFIRKAIKINSSNIVSLSNKRMIKLGDKIIPLYKLADLIKEKGEDRFVIVVEYIGDNIGIIVDDIIRFYSLVYKPLPKSLNGLSGIYGIVFGDDFSIVCVLAIPKIIEKLKSMYEVDRLRRIDIREKRFKNILVVDDSKYVREIECEMLKDEGYNVKGVADGIEAMEELKKGIYNLVITDIAMPRMDGITLIDNIKRDRMLTDIPVIVISNKPPDTIASLLNKINIYIPKAKFDRQILIDKVKELLDEDNDSR